MSANLENSAVATGGKGQFSLQSQRRAMPQNVQTIVQSCLFHMIAKYSQNPSSESSTVCESVHMFKLDLEKAKESDIKFPTSIGSSKK